MIIYDNLMTHRVMLIERRRLEEDEEYFPSSNPVRHVLNFKEAPAELETIIIQAAFPGKGAAHLPCWGNALIPIIIVTAEYSFINEVNSKG